MEQDREREAALSFTEDASAEDLALVLETALDRLGNLGRDGAEALLDKLQERRSDEMEFIEEGLAQLEAVEGVLSGRTDSL